MPPAGVDGMSGVPYSEAFRSELARRLSAAAQRSSSSLEPVVGEEAPAHGRVVDSSGRGGLAQVAGLLQVLEEATAGGGAELVRGARHAPNSLARARAGLAFRAGPSFACWASRPFP